MIRSCLAMGLFLAAVGLVAAPSAAQEEIRPYNRRIVGGEKTDVEHHPWQVALNVRIDGTTYLCGGSIIAQRWVLTAAHCFKRAISASEVRAKAGVTDYVATGSWADIERVVIHDEFNTKTLENDIALVKLRSPAPPKARVISLASGTMDIPIRQPLEVTGWGATEEKRGNSKMLLKATVPHANTTDCNDPLVYNGRIKSGMMCAGYRDGGVDACQGDSGGPLVWRTSSGPILVGVVSWGDGCARKLKYGVYTSVSAYRPWIDRVLAADRK